MLLKNSLTDKQQHFVKYFKLYLGSFHSLLLLYLKSCAVRRVFTVNKIKIIFFDIMFILYVSLYYEIIR